MIPKNLNYGNKVESASCKSYRSNLVPQNGTGNYGLNDVITVNIPTRANLVLATTESYLKFDLVAETATAGASTNILRWDSAGAHGIIQRIRIFHGSNLLEDIDNYNLLAKMLYDIQMPSDAVYNKFNVVSGTRGDFWSTGAADTAVEQRNGGDLLDTPNTADAGYTTTKRTYCLNLISLIGSLCPNFYLPLFAMTSAPLRVEIQLVDNLQKALCAIKGGWSATLSNVEYIAQMMELGDSAMAIVASGLQGKPLQFVFTGYKNFANTKTLTSGVDNQVAMPIPAKYSSLKSLFVCGRDNASGANGRFPLSTITAGIKDYTFKIGSNTMPAKAPNTLEEMFCELMKSIGSISDTSYIPAIDRKSYEQAASLAQTYANSFSNNSGSFYVGIDLENYSNASKDAIFAGYNTNTDDIFFTPTYNPASGINLRLDAFAMFDCLLICENNTAYIKF